MLPCSSDGQNRPRVYSVLAPPVPVSFQRSGRIRLTQGTAMLMENQMNIDSAEAPSLAPDDRPIDLVHLARTTLGDRSLEREVLQLFDRQATLLIARMRTAAPNGVPTLAHTLTGTARGICTW